MKYLVEICCGSYADCNAAAQAKADRIELNSALHMGGLTPSLASFLLAKQHVSIPIIAMVRPRGGGFCYDKHEFETMLEDARILLEHGVDGIAFGCLDEQANIHEIQTSNMCKLIHSYGKEIVFHRAFDCINDPVRAIQFLIDLKVHRILTSGLQPNAVLGIPCIQMLQKQYGDQIQILAGCGVNKDNVLHVLNETGVQQVHSSCKTWVLDPTTSHGNVSYAYASKPNEMMYDIVSETIATELVSLVHDQNID